MPTKPMRGMRFVRFVTFVLALCFAWPAFAPIADADPGPRAARDVSSRRHARRSRHRRSERRSRRAARPAITRAYRQMRDRWHRAASSREVREWESSAIPPLVLVTVARQHRFEIVPDGERGGFDAEDLATASEALTSRRDGESHDVHPRLLDVLYRAVRHFRAPYVHVVSGYRTTRETSRHSQGRAIDIVLPGVSDERLARYLREQGFVGVGVYPTSGFVHLDVRERSYFWTDSSGPGQPTRTRTVLERDVARIDAAARRRGETAVPDEVVLEAEPEEGEASASNRDSESSLAQR